MRQVDTPLVRASELVLRALGRLETRIASGKGDVVQGDVAAVTGSVRNFEKNLKLVFLLAESHGAGQPIVAVIAGLSPHRLLRLMVQIFEDDLQCADGIAVHVVGEL